MDTYDNLPPASFYRKHPTSPVPAARPITDFQTERIGDDLVLLDRETLHYHSLSMSALHVWRACDGVATQMEIAKATRIPIEIVGWTIAELGQAGLLQSPSGVWDATFNRRRATRLITGGLTGAVGLPLVKSITVPSAASAETSDQCARLLPNSAGTCAPPPYDCQERCEEIGFMAGICVDLDSNVSDGCCSCWNY